MLPADKSRSLTPSSVLNSHRAVVVTVSTCLKIRCTIKIPFFYLSRPAVCSIVSSLRLTRGLVFVCCRCLTYRRRTLCLKLKLFFFYNGFIYKGYELFSNLYSFFTDSPF